MMRAVANLSIIFQRLPFLERFEAAAQAGFGEVELWWPRAEFEADLTEDQLVAAAVGAGVTVEMLNFDGGHLPGGERGLAGDPGRAAEFLDNVPRALALAGRLGCTKLNALAGKVVEAATLEQQLAQLRHSIAFAAAAAESVGKVVLVEPLNLAETPGYLLPTVASALDLIADVGRPNVMIQFDVYHVARAGDDPVQTIARAAGHIGHVQIADLPGRHEPGTGGLPFAEIFDALRSAGYEGNVGLEYVPSNHDAPDFGYIDALDRLLEAAAGPSAS